MSHDMFFGIRFLEQSVAKNKRVLRVILMFVCATSLPHSRTFQVLLMMRVRNLNGKPGGGDTTPHVVIVGAG